MISKFEKHEGISLPNVFLLSSHATIFPGLRFVFNLTQWVRSTFAETSVWFKNKVGTKCFVTANVVGLRL